LRRAERLDAGSGGRRSIGGSALTDEGSSASAPAAELRLAHDIRIDSSRLFLSDAVFARDFLGHAKLSTTDRYLSAKRRPEELERLDRAFETGLPRSSRATDASASSS